VSWSTTDSTVASIDASGNLSALDAGEIEVRASVGPSQGVASVKVSKPPVASISISPTVSSEYPGQKIQLTATLKDDSRHTITGPQITWSSSNTTIATVDATGVVTGVARGSAVIAASADGKSATATINVLSVPVASVVVTLPSSTMTTGTTGVASVVLKDAQGNTLTGPIVAWQSSNPAIATIDATGKISALVAGNVSISAISDGVVGSAPLTVANAVPTSITVSSSNVSVLVGQQSQVTATVRDQAGNPMPSQPVTWSSASSSIASVSSSGLITGVSVGSTTVRATSGSLGTNVIVSVSQVPVSSVTVSPTSLSLTVGQTSTLTATARDAANNVLQGRVATWSSSSAAIATVNAQGVVTATGAGDATITATIEGKSASAAVHVSAPAPTPVASVSVTLSATTLDIAQTTQATAVARDASGAVLTGRTVTWASANPSLASVSTSGLVTALGAGTATITATVDGQLGAATLTVAQPPSSPVATVNVQLGTSSLGIGQTTQTSVILLDSHGSVLTGRTITYTSSAPTVASVSATGLVTGVAAGSATITVTSEGQTGTASLTVGTAVPVAYVNVSLNSGQLNVGQTTQAVAVTLSSTGATLTGRTVTWATEHPSVASISSTGVITALSAGSSTITATSEGKSGTVVLYVVAASPTVSVVSVSLTANPIVVGDSSKPSAVAKDAAGNPITGLAVSWSVSGSTAASLSSSGWVKGTSAGTATVVATVSGVSGNSALTVNSTTTTTPPPTSSPPATPTGSAASVLAAMGPTIPSASVPSSIGWYETNFKTNADAQWAAYGPQWDAGNSAAGYDRASIYYVWWARTGDTTYRAKAHATAVNYRIGYIDASGCTPSPHWSQIEGLYLDWIVYGDTASKRAVLCMAEKLDIFSLYVSDSTKDWLDNRIQARLLVAQWAAERIEGTGSKWTAKIDANIPKILGGQASDGHWGFISTCWGSWNFMSGMLDDVLIRMYDQRRADPAILTAVTKSANYLWNTQWRTDQSFNYASLDCLGAGGPSSAPDLNGLILPVYGWLGKKTGDTSWYTKGDAIMNGMKVASLYLYKQLSESYTSSYRYLGWRYGP
jgi:uncharacterized protein YjdB